jgi:hypothetical protein
MFFKSTTEIKIGDNISSDNDEITFDDLKVMDFSEDVSYAFCLFFCLDHADLNIFVFLLFHKSFNDFFMCGIYHKQLFNPIEDKIFKHIC